MLKKLIVNCAYLLRLDRWADLFSGLLLECRRVRMSARVGSDLKWVAQGGGGIDIAGDPTRFKIGEGSHLKSDTFIECSGGVTIGRYFHTARGLTIFSTKHVWKGVPTIPYRTTSEDAPVCIGDCVWVGANVTILPGAQIGSGAIIGAGSVVRGQIPEGSIVIGNPATVVGHRDMDEFWRLYEDKAFF